MRFFLAGLLAFSIASCGLIQREVGYPGGNLGYVADRQALFAKAHEQRVNRFILTLALTAPFVTETVRSSSDAKLTSAAIAELYRTIDQLQKAQPHCALSSDGNKVTLASNCTEANLRSNQQTALDFESLAFVVNKSLYDMLKQGFDNLDLKANVRRILTLEPTELLKVILRARHLVPVLIEYLATYRDVTIIFGQSVVKSCLEQAPKEGSPMHRACGKVDRAFVDLLDRSRDVSGDVAAQERPIRAIYHASHEAINLGLDWSLSKELRIALLHKVNRACRKLELLAQVDDQSFKGCAIEWGASAQKNGTQAREIAGQINRIATPIEQNQ